MGVFRFLMGFGWISRGSTFLGVSTVFQGYFTGCQGIHGFSMVFKGFQLFSWVFKVFQVSMHFHRLSWICKGFWQF